ncbi:hypothetical protein ALC53_12714 [Atta colombica]|uniref:Uncharacterized protein n=1 Tax=Atta colombica TaxID=520822 RepID=A0A195AXR0_9HYME|nr:hypothetical protein ALC53_12714 [Atta colombica]
MWTLYIPQVNGIVGYDCGSTHLNVTLSFLDVESNIPLTQPQIERSYILQLSKFEFIEVIQCKGSINRFIYYCGMHSHLLTVMNAQTEYILEITADQCKIKSNHNANYFHGICKFRWTIFRRNILILVALNRHHTKNNDHLLTSYQTATNLETNQIRLKSGTICPYIDITCMNIDGEKPYQWTIVNVLYEEYVNRFFEHPQIVYSL